MTDHDLARWHVTDEEIDAYWKETLPEAERARVEHHYLDCVECQQRMQLVEMLVNGLRAESGGWKQTSRRFPRWQAAAGVAAAAALAMWTWPRVMPEGNASRPAPANAISPGPATQVVALSPPTRDANVASVSLLSGSTVVVFELDVREAGAPGAIFDIALVAPDGGRRMQLRGSASTSSGVARVPVETSLLAPGRFVFEVTSGSTTIALPFLIAGSQQ